jgi:hypothetical protein
VITLRFGFIDGYSTQSLHRVYKYILLLLWLAVNTKFPARRPFFFISCFVCFIDDRIKADLSGIKRINRGKTEKGDGGRGFVLLLTFPHFYGKI